MQRSVHTCQRNSRLVVNINKPFRQYINGSAGHYRDNKNSHNAWKAIKSSACVYLSTNKVMFWLSNAKILKKQPMPRKLELYIQEFLHVMPAVKRFIFNYLDNCCSILMWFVKKIEYNSIVRMKKIYKIHNLKYPTFLIGSPDLELVFAVISRVVEDAMLGTETLSNGFRMKFIQHYQLCPLHLAICNAAWTAQKING